MKLYYQWGLQDPLLVTLIFVLGHALALPCFWLQRKYHAYREVAAAKQSLQETRLRQLQQQSAWQWHWGQLLWQWHWGQFSLTEHPMDEIIVHGAPAHDPKVVKECFAIMVEDAD